MARSNRPTLIAAVVAAAFSIAAVAAPDPSARTHWVRVEANAVGRVQPPVDRVDEARLDVGAAQRPHEGPPPPVSVTPIARFCRTRRSMCRRAS